MGEPSKAAEDYVERRNFSIIHELPTESRRSSIASREYLENDFYVAYNCLLFESDGKP